MEKMGIPKRCCGLIGFPVTMVVVLVDVGMMDWRVRFKETKEANECMCSEKRRATSSQLFESSSNGGQSVKPCRWLVSSPQPAAYNHQHATTKAGAEISAKSGFGAVLHLPPTHIEQLRKLGGIRVFFVAECGTKSVTRLDQVCQRVEISRAA